MKTRFRVFVSASILLAASCDRANVVDPITERIEGPRYSSTSSSLPVPATNTEGGGIPVTGVGSVGPKKWAIVRVNGSITLQHNPALDACDTTSFVPGGVGATAGPRGLPTAYVQLRVSVGRTYNNMGLTLSEDGSTSAVKSNVIFNSGDTPENINATRSGVEGKKDCGGQTMGYYALSGSQTVTIEELPDPKATATKTLVSSGEAVQFVGSNIPAGFNPSWVWMPGDTTATLKNPPLGGIVITGCNNKKSCTYSPTASGRMYLRFGTGTGTYVHYPTTIVWVGKTPSATLTLSCTPTTVSPGGPTTCTAGTSPAGQSIQVQEWFTVTTADTAMTSVCGTGTVCTAAVTTPLKIYVRALVGGFEQTKDVTINVGPPLGSDTLRVTVTCTAAQVLRGTDVSCSATTDPQATITGWTFTPDDGSLGVVHDTGITPWYGLMVTSGYVTAHAATSNQSATSPPVRVAVNSRTWTVDWDFAGEVYVGQNGLPWYTDGTTVALGANIDLTTNLPTYRHSGGFTVETVSTGPNKDYAYVATQSLKQWRGYWINKYATAHGPEDVWFNNRWYSRYYALLAAGGDPQELITVVTSHEHSSTTGDRSHTEGFLIAIAPGSCGNLAERLEPLVGKSKAAVEAVAHDWDENAYLHTVRQAGHWYVYNHFNDADAVTRTQTDSTALDGGFTDYPNPVDETNGEPPACR